jgi:hypothetical protein
MRRTFTCVMLWLITILPIASFAQNNGQSGTQTVAQSLIPATATGPITYVNRQGVTGSILPNVGQAAHWLKYCVTNVTGIQIQLEESDDGTTNWLPISEIGTSTSGCSILEAGGYFQNVRANILKLTGGGASVAAFYTASTSPITTGGGAKATKFTQPAASPFESASQANQTAFAAVANQNAPSLGFNLLHIFNASTNTRTIYFRRAFATCTLACQIIIDQTNSLGTCTYGGGSPFNMTGGSALQSQAAYGTACTVNPGLVDNPIFLNLQANQTLEFDLEGFVLPPNNVGLGAVPNSGAGQFIITFEYYEK